MNIIKLFVQTHKCPNDDKERLIDRLVPTEERHRYQSMRAPLHDLHTAQLNLYNALPHTIRKINKRRLTHTYQREHE